LKEVINYKFFHFFLIINISYANNFCPKTHEIFRKMFTELNIEKIQPSLQKENLEELLFKNL